MMPSKPATTTLVKANKQLARRVKQSVQHPSQVPIHLLPSISPGQLQRLLSTVSLTGSASHPRLDEPGFFGRFWPAERARSVDDAGSGKLSSRSEGEVSGARNGSSREVEATRHGRMRQRDSREHYSSDFPFFPMPAIRPVPLNAPPTPLSLVVRPPSRSSSPTPEPPRNSADTLPSLAVSPSATVPEVQPITMRQTKPFAASQTLQDISSDATPPSPPLTEDGANEDEAMIDTGRFMFHVGWSGLPKQRPSDHSPSPTPLPNPFTPTKLNSTCVGEDAFFQLPYALGIADGVGGWSRKGDVRADPRRWGGLLMHFCSEEIGDWAAAKGDYAEPVGVSTTSGSTSSVKSKERKDTDWKRSLSGWNDGTSNKPHGRRSTADPTLMMQKGYEKCLACFTAEGSRGSSTCLLAVLQDDSLHVANLGDCSLFIIRNGEIVHQTTEMQHAFNWPMQLGTKQKDTPMKDAMEDTWKVEKHDVVVMGSDGLTDNLCVDTITDILAGFAPPTDDIDGRPPTPPDSEALPAFCPQKLSEALCHRAQEISEELGAETPFMHKAIDNGINFVGGKRDDITVLVGLIGERK